MLESQDDRLEMIRSLGGVEAVIDDVIVEGIFDNAYVPVDDGQFIVEATSPRFMCRTVDLPTIANNETLVVVGGQQYVVVENMQDGTGMSEIRLRETNP